MEYIEKLSDEKTLLGMIVCIEKRKQLKKELKENENRLGSLEFVVQEERHISTENLIYNDEKYYMDKEGNVLFECDRPRKITSGGFCHVILTKYAFLPNVMLLGIFLSCLFGDLYRSTKNDFFFLLILVGVTMLILAVIGTLVVYVKQLDDYRDKDIIIKHNELARKNEQSRAEKNRQITNRNIEVEKKNREIDARNDKRRREAEAKYNQERECIKEKIDYCNDEIRHFERQFDRFREELKMSIQLCRSIDDEKALETLYLCYDMVKSNLYTKTHCFRDVQEYYIGDKKDEKFKLELIGAIKGVKQGIDSMQQDIYYNLSKNRIEMEHLKGYINELDDRMTKHITDMTSKGGRNE